MITKATYCVRCAAVTLFSPICHTCAKVEAERAAGFLAMQGPEQPIGELPPGVAQRVEYPIGSEGQSLGAVVPRTNPPGEWREITAAWFEGDHPNALHPQNVTIDPVARTVALFGTKLIEGDRVWCSADGIAFGAHSRRQLQQDHDKAIADLQALEGAARDVAIAAIPIEVRRDMAQQLIDNPPPLPEEEHPTETEHEIPEPPRPGDPWCGPFEHLEDPAPVPAADPALIRKHFPRVWDFTDARISDRACDELTAAAAQLERLPLLQTELQRLHAKPSEVWTDLGGQAMITANHAATAEALRICGTLDRVGLLAAVRTVIELLDGHGRDEDKGGDQRWRSKSLLDLTAHAIRHIARAAEASSHGATAIDQDSGKRDATHAAARTLMILARDLKDVPR